MSNMVLGLMAHVDAGKTSMAEALLYSTGAIRTKGRVDHRDCYLDNGKIERARGITIFSKQAVFNIGGKSFDLLDTPGHMDFSSETERTLSVLDYAILVISAPDGVQSHTQTLWQLLRRYGVPCFVWINKMDICSRSRKEILEGLAAELDGAFIEMTGFPKMESGVYEELAACDEEAIEEYLKSEKLSVQTMQTLIENRKLFPCFFGSALKPDGMEPLLKALELLTKEKAYPKDFSAKVFKITRDEQGNRLSWLKITGGTIRVREEINGEKLTQIRKYSGAKFESRETASAGEIYSLLGLEKTYAGQGIGKEKENKSPMLEPVLSYRIVLPEGSDSAAALKKLSLLSEEDPLLRIVWNTELKEIDAQLMGPVQIEVLKELISERFGFDVQIEAGRILYKESIASPVEGMGHFEPLRHYAEVHLLLEPLAPGSGIIIESAVSTDVLDINWQRLVLTNIAEKKHVGVLTGSPLTDVKITLVAGRAHLKHTEGGDFRQAVYRAVRQGLMKADNVLLEPWYSFLLSVPSEYIGRAISDLKSMSASFDAPRELGSSMSVSGRAPAGEMQGYQLALLSYTRGKGRLSCHFSGYYPCHNTEKVIEYIGYDPERDVENTADSVFCSHGAGVTVKWDAAESFMHLDSGLRFSEKGSSPEYSGSQKLLSGNMDFDEKELEELMLKEFGPVKRPRYAAVKYDFDRKNIQREIKKSYIIADGYNLIFSWEELKKTAKESIGEARERLIEKLKVYHAFRGCELVLVFDGYKMKGNPGEQSLSDGMRVIYTKEGETADAYIERLVHELGKSYSIKVASSDALIQLAALRMGVLRMSSAELEHEVEACEEEIAEILNNQEKGHFNIAAVARLSDKGFV